MDYTSTYTPGPSAHWGNSGTGFATHATHSAYGSPASYLTPSIATATDGTARFRVEGNYPVSDEVYTGIQELDKRKECKTKTKTKTFHETQTLYVTPKSGAANPTRTEYVPISYSPRHLEERGEEETQMAEDVQEYPEEYGGFVWSHDEESDLSELAAREPKGRGGGKGWGKKKSGCTDYETVFETAIETATVVMTPEAASQTSEVPGEMTLGTQEFIPKATFESNAQGRPQPFALFRRR